MSSAASAVGSVFTRTSSKKSSVGRVYSAELCLDDEEVDAPTANRIAYMHDDDESEDESEDEIDGRSPIRVSQQ